MEVNGSTSLIINKRFGLSTKAEDFYDDNGFWWFKNSGYASMKNFEPEFFMDYEIYNFITPLKGHNSTVSKDNPIELSSQEFSKRYRNSFDSTLHNTIFIDGEDNNATRMFNSLLNENKSSTLELIQELFLQYFKDNDEKCMIKVLKLFYDYSYNDLIPYSQTIALACRASKSPSVQIATFNLFAHWCNKNSLQLLDGIEIPSNLMAKIVYLSVKNTLKKKCSSSVK